MTTWLFFGYCVASGWTLGRWIGRHLYRKDISIVDATIAIGSLCLLNGILGKLLFGSGG